MTIQSLYLDKCSSVRGIFYIASTIFTNADRTKPVIYFVLMATISLLQCSNTIFRKKIYMYPYMCFFPSLFAIAIDSTEKRIRVNFHPLLYKYVYSLCITIVQYLYSIVQLQLILSWGTEILSIMSTLH